MAKARKSTTSTLNEPAVCYKTKNGAEVENKPSLLDWLGGKRISKIPLRSDFDLITLGSEGIPKSAMDELATKLGISRKALAEDVFDLSVKTLERKSPTDKLDKRTSSHALEIAKVLQHAYTLFEDEGKMQRWLNKENRALNNQRPVQLFGTMTGLKMVDNVIGRIEEGVYS